MNIRRPENAASADSPRKRWTRDEVAKVSELLPEQRLELIRGVVIDKSCQTPGHAYLITLLTEILGGAYPRRLRIQSPISLPDPEGTYSEPEPDLVILRQEIAGFNYRHPGPDDIDLLIEVSDTTLQMDQEIKAALYAHCGVQVYWIVDIQRRRVLALQQPGRDEYKSMMIHEDDEGLTVPAQPSLAFSANRLFEGLCTAWQVPPSDAVPPPPNR
jgi:Uma2 family endonuclease